MMGGLDGTHGQRGKGCCHQINLHLLQINTNTPSSLKNHNFCGRQLCQMCSFSLESRQHGMSDLIESEEKEMNSKKLKPFLCPVSHLDFLCWEIRIKFNHKCLTGVFNRSMISLLQDWPIFRFSEKQDADVRWTSQTSQIEMDLAVI